jgi:hypothetical protein
MAWPADSPAQTRKWTVRNACHAETVEAPGGLTLTPNTSHIRRLMPAAAEQLPPVDEPKRPLAQLTTYELKAYRRQLQSAVEFFGFPTRVAPRLGDVVLSGVDRTACLTGDRVDQARGQGVKLDDLIRD